MGGGPAGLYLAILLKKADPSRAITVVERNRPDDTFGFGVVFSDATLENFQEADPESHEAITGAFAHWYDIDVHYQGQVITSTGHGFSGLARQMLLDILQERCHRLEGPTGHEDQADRRSVTSQPTVELAAIVVRASKKGAVQIRSDDEPDLAQGSTDLGILAVHQRASSARYLGRVTSFTSEVTRNRT